MDEKEKKVAWTIEVGFYPGIVVGIRTLRENQSIQHTFFIYRL